MSDAVVLHQYFPSPGLQAYMRLAGISHKVYDSHYPHYESVGALPAIFSGDALVGGSKARVLTYLRSRATPAADATLSVTQHNYMLACLDTVLGTLEDVLLWCHTYHHDENAMSKQTMWGLRWIFTSREGTKNRAYLTQKGMGADAALWVEEIARQAYSSLGAIYSSAEHSPYYSGTSPCTLDAMLYGHLAEMRITVPGGDWVAKYAMPALAPLFSQFKQDVFGRTAAHFVAITAPITHIGSNIFDKREAQLEGMLAAEPRPAPLAVVAPTVPVETPQAASSTPSEAKETRETRPKTTVHGRMLTGIDAVDVATTRLNFEGTPADNEASAASTTAEVNQSDALNQLSNQNVTQSNQANELNPLGFGLSKRLQAEEKKVGASPIQDFLVTVGIITIGAVVMKAALSK